MSVMAILDDQRVSKRLGDLIEGIDPKYMGLPVTGMCIDSRNVREGDLFIACKGFHADGRGFINEAASFGAAAILAEKGDAWLNDQECQGVPVIVVDELPKKVSELAASFFDNPSLRIPVIGVTGTNGKTSCTQFILQLLIAMQKSAATIGTLGAGIGADLDESVNTTPDPVSIQHLLHNWVNKSVDLVAMEVSSHGLDQSRVEDVYFKAAIFTNLTRDHLDYHGSFEAYGQAKRKLFHREELEAAIINIDDPFSEALITSLYPQTQLYTYSLGNQSADIYAEDIVYSANGIECLICSAWGNASLKSHLIGRFNLSNLLGVIAALCSVGHSFERVVASVTKLAPVAGRMERLSTFSDIHVFIDYAHTPDALESALDALKLHCEGKLWCVFGCGGDRDSGKRAIMGAAADRLADHVVVTSDNPRFESPDKIIQQILEGMSNSTAVVEVDRALAIEYAIVNAEPGDTILIAGKGHEDYQQVGQEKLSFNDATQARLAMAKRRVHD